MSSLRVANLGITAFEIHTKCIYFCIMIIRDFFFHFLRQTSISRYPIILIALLMVFGSGCSKIIDIDIPPTSTLLVVEGSIRNGESPFVLLSESQGYFDPVGTPGEGFYLGGAEVTVSVNGTPYLLDEICTTDLSPEDLEQVATMLGMDAEILSMFPLCAYTSLNEPALIGVEGSKYDLHVLYDTLEVTSSSILHYVIPIDSAYFLVPSTSENDSLGFIWTTYTDPDTLGNSFRWSSRRVGQDPSFIYPLGSAWNDSFINGQTFTFSFFRYSADHNSEPEGEYGFWKTGDTVKVRLETIDESAYDAVMTFEAAASAQGNPFAPPTNVKSNIEGGLGWWIAYSASEYTVICN
ncbi:MAG TPA: DUF4249 domain-containing protein [Flavobacteriales bacterium]|nr:DUF4249 domain-containing protein [Flavobacteriales bacterium]